MAGTLSGATREDERRPRGGGSGEDANDLSAGELTKSEESDISEAEKYEESDAPEASQDSEDLDSDESAETEHGGRCGGDERVDRPQHAERHKGTEIPKDCATQLSHLYVKHDGRSTEASNEGPVHDDTKEDTEHELSSALTSDESDRDEQPDSGTDAESVASGGNSHGDAVVSTASVDSSNAESPKSITDENEAELPTPRMEKEPKLSNLSKKTSRKRGGKVATGTSENPLDITDLTVDSGSLLQLYQNEYFDAYMHMHHLYHKKEAGVHEYLVNLLYSKRSNQEVTFYLPQLCQLSISKYGKSSLHRFLLDRASTSMHFALKLSWFYQAIISDQATKLGNLAQKMTQETEMAVVNCKLISPVSACHAPVEDRELELCSKGLMNRRLLIRAIRAKYRDAFNDSTDMDLLEKPKLSSQLAQNALTLVTPASKVKLPTPYAKIGSPVDLEIHPYVECNDEMQYELERLMMKQRRLDYFNLLSNFVRLCMDISKLLTSEPKRDAREPLLDMFARSVNEWMLLQRCTVAAYEESFAYRGLSFPMRKMGYDRCTNIPFQFLRIVVEEIKIFFSKKRAPFVFYFEIANLDEDVKLITGNEEARAQEAVDGVTFRDLYVFDAIVKDLVASQILTADDVACLKNPLECIRHAMGMLPQEAVNRFEQRKAELTGARDAESEASKDEDTEELATADQEHPVGSKTLVVDKNGDASQPASRAQSTVETKFPLMDQMSPEEARAVVFPELLVDKKERLRKQSPYGHLKSWNVRAVIIKGGDDLRQELMVNQLLTLFRDIFVQAKLPLWLRPIEILVTGANCGIMEFLHDTCSVDVIKRKFNVESIGKIFEKMYADKLFEARKNFIESHAAYSIISYLLQVKDRHNGNMMLDNDGHIVHIDYGFCLSNTPGNINFETSPFKLTKEYLDIIGGENSDNFEYFRTLVIRGLLEARKHMDRIVLLVDMMTDANKMPCFAAGTGYTMDMFRDRFMLNLSEDVCIDRIVAMIEESVNNFRTVQYDNFQRLTNGIK